jgi:uncharacterized protein (DUF58 family)
MNPVLLTQAHAAAVGAAARLRLPLRSRVWRGQAGEFNGSGTGSSLDFQDHRAYSPGDDPRHINWQAYARTGNYTMKLFREEVRPVVDVVMDVSESMFYLDDKARRSAEILYFIVESCQLAGASLNVHLVRGRALVRCGLSDIRSHRWQESVRALAADDPSAPPELTRLDLRANAIRVFISDLLFAADPEPMFRDLGRRHGSIIVFAPFTAGEARPDWSGNVEFIDAEENTRHPHRIEVVTLQRYREAYQSHFALWKSSAVRHQAAFARIPAEEDLSAALHREAVIAGALETNR